jgi:hypothetical protein
MVWKTAKILRAMYARAGRLELKEKGRLGGLSF